MLYRYRRFIRNISVSNYRLGTGELGSLPSTLPPNVVEDGDKHYNGNKDRYAEELERVEPRRIREARQCSAGSWCG